MTPAVAPATRAALEARARETCEVLGVHAPVPEDADKGLNCPYCLVIFGPLSAAHAEGYEAGREQAAAACESIASVLYRDARSLREACEGCARAIRSRALATPTPERSGGLW